MEELVAEPSQHELVPTIKQKHDDDEEEDNDVDEVLEEDEEPKPTRL